MPRPYHQDPCDLPYGPGNPDYEYDGRDDDAADAAHHADELIHQQETEQ